MEFWDNLNAFMKKLIALILLLSICSVGFSQESDAPTPPAEPAATAETQELSSFDQKLDNFLKPIAKWMGKIVFFSVPVGKGSFDSTGSRAFSRDGNVFDFVF